MHILSFKFSQSQFCVVMLLKYSKWVFFATKIHSFVIGQKVYLHFLSYHKTEFWLQKISNCCISITQRQAQCTSCRSNCLNHSTLTVLSQNCEFWLQKIPNCNNITTQRSEAGTVHILSFKLSHSQYTFCPITKL